MTTKLMIRFQETLPNILHKVVASSASEMMESAEPEAPITSLEGLYLSDVSSPKKSKSPKKKKSCPKLSKLVRSIGLAAQSGPEISELEKTLLSFSSLELTPLLDKTELQKITPKECAKYYASLYLALPKIGKENSRTAFVRQVCALGTVREGDNPCSEIGLFQEGLKDRYEKPVSVAAKLEKQFIVTQLGTEEVFDDVYESLLNKAGLAIGSFDGKSVEQEKSLIQTKQAFFKNLDAQQKESLVRGLVKKYQGITRPEDKESFLKTLPLYLQAETVSGGFGTDEKQVFESLKKDCETAWLILSEKLRSIETLCSSDKLIFRATTTGAVNDVLSLLGGDDFKAGLEKQELKVVACVIKKLIALMMPKTLKDNLSAGIDEIFDESFPKDLSKLACIDDEAIKKEITALQGLRDSSYREANSGLTSDYEDGVQAKILSEFQKIKITTLLSETLEIKEDEEYYAEGDWKKAFKAHLEKLKSEVLPKCGFAETERSNFSVSIGLTTLLRDSSDSLMTEESLKPQKIVDASVRDYFTNCSVSNPA
ncbi:hypothetical protein DID77_03630 [Candidatus Marinamargulisbacteria bacterium SCGC AG-439-L15]|nr:hypothetical protein DID77_03630 [Candidatus Marinamargulisbacteria bacterium SCGC AG-439-L15]